MITHEEVNALPVHNGWAFDEGKERKAAENRATYDAIKDLFEFGECAAEDKVVVRLVKNAYKHDEYRVLSNPYNIDAAHIALFCDRGSLVFGYSVRGPLVCVHND